MNNNQHASSIRPIKNNFVWMKNSFTILLALICLNIHSAVSQTFNLTQYLIESAQGSPSEATPYGVPGNWDWVAGATLSSLSAASPYTHANYWGAVFRGMSNTTPANTEVQIKLLSMWVLYNDADGWIQFQDQSSNLGGGTFSPTYKSGGPAPALRHTSEGSFVVPAPGYIWHFWHGPGFEPIQNNIREILVNAQVRLVLKDPNGVDDRSLADYLIHMGADKRNPNDPNCANNNYICPSFGVGKFVQITNEWKNASWHSISQSDIANNIPLPPADIFAQPTVSDTLTIMPIGNSLTEANPGYKGFLWNVLAENNYRVKFVGPKTDAGTNYLNHAGFGGYTIGPDPNIYLDAVDPWGRGNILYHIDNGYKLIDYNADAWLLEIGTNDFWNQNTYDPRVTGADRLDDLVGKIFTHDPDLILFLGNILPLQNDANYASLFNSEIPAIIEKYTNMGFAVYLVDMNKETGLINTDYSDNIHLNAAGYKKMADVWYDAFSKNIDTNVEVGIRVPFKDSAFQMPGKIEAEHYDFGGQGVAYHDSTPENTGNDNFRKDNVDIDGLNGQAKVVVDFDESEWLTYTMNIPNGQYDIALRMATINEDCQLQISLMDSLNDPTYDTLALFLIANSGNLSAFNIVNFNDINVSNGGEKKILRVKVLSGSCSFDWLMISAGRTGHLLNNTPGSLSEAAPFGVPSNWNWVTAATEATLNKEDNYTHTNFWGAIFRNNNNTTPTNSVVQIANCSYYILYNDSTEWTYIQGHEFPLGGSTFSPTYHGSSIDPVELGHTDEGMFIVPAEGNIYHFWYGPGYEPFLFNNVRAVIVNMHSRLVLNDPDGVDDRNEAGYLIHVGSDWRDPSDGSCSSTNHICPGFGVSKLDSITVQWRNHTFHSLSEDDILNGLIPLPPDSIFYLPGNKTPESWVLSGSLLTGEEELLYQEDFSNNKLNGWTPETGTWNISGSQLNNPTAKADEIAYYGNATFQNFILTAQGIPTWNNDFGLVYNFQDKDNYYVLTVDPSPPIARIRINQAGVFDTIAEKEYPVSGNAVLMELKHDGTKTTAFVNGQQIFKNIPTDEFRSGHIGAYSWWCPMKFDNFKVYAALESDSSMTIVSVPINSLTSNTIKVSPNPIHSSVIHLSADEPIYNATVSIFSITGNLISTRSVDIINRTPIDLDPNLGKGIYILEITTHTRKEIKKIILL